MVIGQLQSFVCCVFQGALGSSNPILRCAAGEALGRMAQVVGESKFIAEMAQYSFDRCVSENNLLIRNVTKIHVK